MLPRLVATDLDGTIIRRDGTVSARVRNALKAAEDNGALVVYVSGRPPRWMDVVADQTGATGLAVCANGAALYDLHTRTVVDSRLLDGDALREIAAALNKELPGLRYALEYGDDFSHEPDYVHHFNIGLPEHRVAAYAELLDRPALKLLAQHPDMDPDELLARAEAVLGETATVTHSSSTGLLEVAAAGVTKASGLARLADQHGIAADEVVAFGDMPNDLPMLAWAGHAVAVGNAHPAVLEVADEVTASVADDGVALVLERLMSTRT